MNWKKEKFYLSRLNSDNVLVQVPVNGWTKNGVGIAKDCNIHGEPVDYGRGYGIYHLNSGLLIIHSNGYKETKQKAEAILKLTNWHKKAKLLKAEIPVYEKVHEIADGIY